MFAKQEKKSMLTAKTELNELFTVTSAQFFYDYVLPVLRDLFELDCRENTVINGLLNGGFALSTVLEGWSKEVKKHIPTATVSRALLIQNYVRLFVVMEKILIVNCPKPWRHY
ncbi:MAG: hypothetical protein LRY69_07850 [Gammaproteobacteria bacterium]|nr:hypothetical protein [Gammaproteobacteria bacterium]